jgi:hypothetical protein
MSSRRHQARRRRQRLSRQLAHARCPAPTPAPVPVPMALAGSGRLCGRVLHRNATSTPVPDMPSPGAAQRREPATPTPMQPTPTPPPLVGSRPCAATPFALVRWLPNSLTMREPTCFFPTHEQAVSAAAILIDEPWSVVNAMVSVKNPSSIIDEMLARGRANGLHHDRDDDPLKAARDRPPADDHPWKNGRVEVDAGRVSTSWRVRSAGAGTLTAVALCATERWREGRD